MWLLLSKEMSVCMKLPPIGLFSNYLAAKRFHEGLEKWVPCSEPTLWGPTNALTGVSFNEVKWVVVPLYTLGCPIINSWHWTSQCSTTYFEPPTAHFYQELWWGTTGSLRQRSSSVVRAPACQSENWRIVGSHPAGYRALFSPRHQCVFNRSHKEYSFTAFP